MQKLYRSFQSLLMLWIIIIGTGYAQNVNILLLIPHHYGANYNFFHDDFERFGWNITRAGLKSVMQPCPLFAAKVGCENLPVDSLITEINDIQSYDCVALMPATWRTGDPYHDIMGSQETMELITNAATANKLIWTTCAGGRVLAAADLLQGKKVVGQPAFRDELEKAGATFLGTDVPPHRDGNIITSARGQYYHLHNSDAIKFALEQSANPEPRPAQHVASLEMHSIALSDTDQAVWTKTYGGADAEGGRSVCETKDGHLVVTGYTYSFGNGFADVLLIKTNAAGNPIWQRTFGGTGWEFGNGVCESTDGGLALTGYTTSSGAGNRDVWVIKTDALGNKIWSKTFGGPLAEMGRAICATPDGSMVVCGSTQSFSKGEEDIYLLKLNANGDTLWTRTFGHERSEVGQAVHQARDGGLIVVGVSGSEHVNNGNMDIYVIKTDANGNPEWDKMYGNKISPHPFDFGNAVCETSGRELVLISDSDVRSPLDIYMVKVDSAGNELWHKNFGRDFYDYGNSVIETEDGYWVCGATKSGDSGNNDLFLLKIDADGNEISREIIGGNGSDWGTCIIKAQDGTFIITGHTNSFGAGKLDLWLLKVS